MVFVESGMVLVVVVKFDLLGEICVVVWWNVGDLEVVWVLNEWLGIKII